MDMDIILVAMCRAIWGIMICKLTKNQRKLDLMADLQAVIRSKFLFTASHGFTEKERFTGDYRVEVPFHCFTWLHRKRIDYLTNSTIKYILIWITRSLKP